jgi:lysophospholipase L1-like esterase
MSRQAEPASDPRAKPGTSGRTKPPSPGAAEPRFGLGKSLLFSAILILGFFALAELTVRGWAYYLRDDVEKFDAATNTFVLVPGVHRSSAGLAHINSDGFAGPELFEDGTDLWRIVAIGDSCTYGGGHLTESYPAHLQRLLEDRPGRRYEVVNAGISGLDSELALRRLVSKVLPLEPDVVTLYLGWNDLMKYDPVSQAGESPWSGVARLLDRMWLAKGLRKLIFFHLRPSTNPPRTGTEGRSGRFTEFKPAVYEANLREMVRAIREAGAEPLLITLSTVVREDMSAEDLRRAGVVFPYFPSAYGTGDLRDLVASYNRAVRRVGIEMGVPVADLGRRFDALPDPTPFFWGTMHTNHEGNALVAAELARELEENGLLAAEGETAGRGAGS